MVALVSLIVTMNDDHPFLFHLYLMFRGERVYSVLTTHDLLMSSGQLGASGARVILKIEDLTVER
jgi:hypothetical protein